MATVLTMPEVVNSGHVHADALPGGQAELNLDPALLAGLRGSVGSNANGHYARFDNGLQVCWGYNVIPYGATSDTWTYPVPFSTSYTVTVVPVPRRGSSPGTFSLRVGATLTATHVLLERTGGDISVDAVAVGRWK